ncbi:MAG TPA: amidohydrolase [Thermoleophilia bacterium]|nr:amidohydrolase [Thermoleophilia bacterium]
MADPELILTNGRVYTVDPRRSEAEAVVVRHGRIAAVSTATEALAQRGPQTRVVDLDGRLVLPGFIDAHMHPMGALSDLYEPSLRGVRTVDECLDRVAAFLAEHPGTPFVTGWSWSTALLDEAELTAERLDRVVPDRPAVLYDEGGHTVWVNGATLKRADVSASAPDASGILREGAISLIERALPRRPVSECSEGLLHFQRDVAAPFGLTTVQESVVRPGDPLLEAYEELQARAELTVRTCVSLWVEEDLPLRDQLAALAAERSRHSGPLVRAGCAKFFADGVVEGHTAYLHDEYADRPGYRGEPIWPADHLAEASAAAAKAGFQLHYHAIGDAAVGAALDAIAFARRAVDPPPARSLVTHLQLVDPADIQRMAELDVVALPQPYWFAKDDMYHEVQVPYLGQPRADVEYPMRSLWGHGVRVASASDYPVVASPDPIRGIRHGALRSSPEAGDSESDALWPEERVTVVQMIESFTINGAYANFLEDETGSIEVGKSADLLVLSDDILELGPRRISEARVLLTLFRGMPVHAEPPFDAIREGETPA